MEYNLIRTCAYRWKRWGGIYNNRCSVVSDGEWGTSQARPLIYLTAKNWIFFLKALLHTSNDVFQISWKPRLGYCNFFLSIIIFFLKNEKYNFYDGDFLLATIQVLRKKYWKFVLRFLD